LEESAERGFLRTRAQSVGSKLLPGPPGWARQAACLGKTTREHDPWHPPADALPSVRRALVAEAVAVCVTCPVQVACGRHGLEMLADESVIAVYGGMTPDALRDIARRIGRPTRRTPRHGTRSRYVGPEKCRCDLCRAANQRYEHARRAARRRRDCPALTVRGEPCGRPSQPGSIFCVAHAIPDPEAARLDLVIPA
jgi:hypothetical protein